MVLVLENPVLLSYSLQLTPGQNLLRTMQLMSYILILPRLLIWFLTNAYLLSWSPTPFWKPLRLIEKLFVWQKSEGCC